jgi:hypothetical protein
MRVLQVIKKIVDFFINSFEQKENFLLAQNFLSIMNLRLFAFSISLKRLLILCITGLSHQIFRVLKTNY